jgi:signal transduction histidine kinase
MKLFWKFFFSIMIVTQLCISIGCHVLIQYSYHQSLEKEINYTYNENDNIYYLCYSYLDFINDQDTAFSIDDMYNDLSFQFVKNDEVLVDHHYNSDINMNLDNNQRGYQIIKKNNKYYIYCSRTFTYNEEMYCINNQRDISDIFILKNTQYRIYSIIIIVEFFISSIVIALLCHFLVSPIKRLSQATKQLANHQYDIDLPINRNDELGMLSKDFMNMSNQIEDYILSQDLFIGNFAHELKTPLTSIIGYGDMLRSKRLSEEEIIVYSHKIVEEGKRLENISKKLMNLIVLKKHDFTFQSISSTEFFDSIYTTVMPNLNQIEFHMQIEEHMMHIEIDLMKSAILNLIDNARNAIDNQGKINLKFYKLNDDYIIEVIDNGEGMDKEDVKRVTEAFYMVDKSRTRKHGGAGLGLAIVNSIVLLHNGTLEIDSLKNVGTTMRIRLKENSND